MFIMTISINPDQIPEAHLNLLIKTATQIIKKTPDGYAYCKVPLNNFQSYVLWIGLNSSNVLEEHYFLTDDFVLSPIKNRQ